MSVKSIRVSCDDLGDRMKGYEAAEAARAFMPGLPILARVDGRAFHSFTRGMQRPYDANLSACMIAATTELVKATGATVGYAQSDEITLAWRGDSPVWFGGRVMKMTSQLAALATLHFYRAVVKRMPEFADRMPSFDARVWNVPNLTEAANVFVWREWDAIKNSISMAASANFSAPRLHGRTSQQRLDMLADAGVDWEQYPTCFKRGTYVQRVQVIQRAAHLSEEELNALPEKHAARTDPNFQVVRHPVEAIEMPRLTTLTAEDRIFRLFGVTGHSGSTRAAGDEVYTEDARQQPERT